MALELLYPEQNDRTVFRNDSLITFRKVSVTVLARFYSSEGRLIGSLRNTVSREGTIPYSPDTGRMAVLASEEIAESALLEMFPVEASFTASGEELFTIPLGRAQGIDNGTVMALVAASSGIPDDPGQYEDLRSRGLLQVMDAGENESRARLLSGRLTPGGNVTAVEQSAPASIFLEYCGVMSDVKMGQGLDPEDNAWSNNARLGVHTTKWGFSFGGGINTGGLEHSSMIGVDLLSGVRLPLSSPALGLRLLAGGEIAFHMQDVRSTEILSNATDVTVGAIADVTLEYLFSDHLGIQAGVIGSISTTADSWTVQDYTGEVRDAEPDEIYYTEMKQGPVGAHIGLMYLIF